MDEGGDHYWIVFLCSRSSEHLSLSRWCPLCLVEVLEIVKLRYDADLGRIRLNCLTLPGLLDGLSRDLLEQDIPFLIHDIKYSILHEQNLSSLRTWTRCF